MPSLVAQVTAVAASTQFAATAIGMSTTQNVMLNITSALNITGIAAAKSQGNKQEYSVGTITGCTVDSTGTTSTAAGSVCTVSVTFTPAYPGRRWVPLQVSTQSGSTTTIYPAGLYGIGTGAQATFQPGIISTVAGDGTQGYNGDGIAATAAELFYPQTVAVDSAGNVYIADANNNRIRKVSAGTGVISTVAGNGTPGYNGDGIPATTAELDGPSGVAVDAAGNLYIADFGNETIRMVSAATGLISTVAGDGYVTLSGDGGYNGDNIPATSAELNGPYAIALDSSGNLFIADAYNNRIRKVTASNGIITTVAGDAGVGYNGDGILATSAKLNGPSGVALDSAGDIYIADNYNSRIREVSVTTGMISTVAGDGSAGFGNDGVAATTTEINYPNAVALDSAGDLYIADDYNGRIRFVSASTGLISTLAGNGTWGYAGDGTAANTAELYYPLGVAVDGNGNVYVVDEENARIRMVDVADAPSLTFAATAVNAASSPQSVTVQNTGNVALNFTIPSTGTNPSISANFYLNSTASLACPVIGSTSSPASLSAGASCSLLVSFTPTVAGNISGSLVLTDNNLNATKATQTISLAGVGTIGSQTITFTPPTSPVTYGVSPITLSATASSGLTVTFSIVSGPGSISGTTLTITGAGTIVIAANQSGNSSFAAAPQVTQSIVVNPALLTVTAQPASRAYGAANPTFTDSITGFVNGDNSSVVSGSASLTTTATTSSPVGGYPITAAQGSLSAANYTFAFAPSLLTVAQAAQAISFAVASPVTFGVGPIMLSASGGASGNAVTFSIISGPGSLIGSTLTVTGGGTIVIAANQAGNSNYSAAPQVTQSLVVNPIAQSIVFPNPGTQAYGVAPITLTASATSGLPVAYTIVSGPATVSGSTLTITAAGTVVVQASQSGNADYAAAVPVSVSFTVTGADYTLSINPSSLSISQGGSSGSTGSATLTLTPIGGFNQAVQFACTDMPNHTACAFSPATVTPNGAAVTTTVTLATDGAVAFNAHAPGRLGLALAACFVPFSLLALRRRSAIKHWQGFVQLGIVLGLLVAGMGLSGCGSGGTAPPWWPVTPLGTYTVTVNATTVSAGGPSHTAHLAVTITQ